MEEARIRIVACVQALQSELALVPADVATLLVNLATELRGMSGKLSLATEHLPDGVDFTLLLPENLTLAASTSVVEATYIGAFNAAGGSAALETGRVLFEEEERKCVALIAQHNLHKRQLIFWQSHSVVDFLSFVGNGLREMSITIVEDLAEKIRLWTHASFLKYHLPRACSAA